MPVSVRCRSCGTSLTVKDSFIGKRINCRDCGAPIDVTRGSAASSRPRSSKSKSTSGGGNGLLIGGIVGGVVFLVTAIGVGVVVANRLSGARQPDANGAFAPNGQAVNVTGNDPAVAATPSRFDLPAQGGAGGAPLSPPAQSGPVNPHAGVGLGNVIGVTNYWKDRRGGGDSGPEEEFVLFSQEPDSISPELWDVKVDPPETPIVFAPERPNVRVKVPEGSVRATPQDILFPVVASPFVAVGQNGHKDDKREIWDLTKPEKVGTITNFGVETKLIALSPDGKYFAGQTGLTTQYIGVWDVAAKQPLVEIEVQDLGRVAVLAMPRSDMVIAGARFGGSPPNTWWRTTSRRDRSAGDTAPAGPTGTRTISCGAPAATISQCPTAPTATGMTRSASST